MKERVAISGKVIVEWVEGGKVVRREVHRNKVTTLGLALFAALVAGAGTPPSHIALGTGYTAPTVGDLTLEAEVARTAIIATTHPDNSVQYTATFGPGVATGTMREAGVFNGPGADTMSNRAVFTTPLVKASYQTINIIWLVTFNN